MDAVFPPMPRERARLVDRLLRDCTLPKESNAGLVFDRYFSIWEWWAGEGGEAPVWPNVVKDKDKDGERRTPRRDALVDFVTRFNERTSHRDNAERLRAHQERLSRALPHAVSRRLVTASSLAVGLGASHPLENGLTLDPTLGVPFVPGSALKGLCRAWAELLATEGSASWATVDRIFGAGGGEGAAAGLAAVRGSAGGGAKPGTVRFLAAHPVTWPTLELDLVNPHHPKYYRPPASERERREAQPADWDAPVPASFLCVAPGVPFQFRIVPGAVGAETSGREAADAAQAMTWLEEAIEVLGVGAKTTVGYGCFRALESEGPGALERLALTPPATVAEGIEVTGQPADVVAVQRVWERSGLVVSGGGAHVDSYVVESTGPAVTLTGPDVNAVASSTEDAARQSLESLMGRTLQRWVRRRGAGERPLVVVTSYGRPQPAPERVTLFELESPAAPDAPKEHRDDFAWAVDRIAALLQRQPGAQMVALHPKCTPAAALRLGYAFRKVTGLGVECSQSTAWWDLDAPAGSAPEPSVQSGPGEVHLLLSASQSVRAAYEAWLQEQGSPAGAVVEIAAPQIGTTSIPDAATAVAWAEAARAAALQAKANPRAPIRVFTAAPNAVLVALGRVSNAWGRVIAMDWDRTATRYFPAYDFTA